MSEGTFISTNTSVRFPNWGAIWSGVFTFFAISSVFGLLGMSIFANAPRTAAGMNVGLGVWFVILTIIAMYVAGRVTGHLAGIANSGDGLTYGMVMFGLATLIIFGIGAFAGTGVGALNAAETHRFYMSGMFGDAGWFGFASLFLGWLAAMGGASTEVHDLHTSVQEMSHAH